MEVDFSELAEVLEKIEENHKKDNNSWKLIIEKVKNGYILDGKFGDNNITSKIAIEEKDTRLGAKEAMMDLLFRVKEYFACYYSKHDKNNVIVEMEEK